MARFQPDRSIYPFPSRWFDSSVGPVHYVDEGQGQPVLLLHGNPDWSFLYRHIIRGLDDNYRCIAPDYPGFGLSPHPAGYRYRPQDHAKVVVELVEELNLQDMIVVGADWGGPIGMSVAATLNDRVGGLVMGNTFFWPQKDWRVRTFSRVMATTPMQYLIIKRNLMVNTIMKQMLQTEVTDQEMDHYRDVAPTPQSRAGFAVLPVAAITAESWLIDLDHRVRQRLSDKPMLLIFGLKDPILANEDVIGHWSSAFPDAPIVRLPEAGHFFQEDAPNAVVEAIKNMYPATREDSHS